MPEKSVIAPKKLIEVALPLDVINAASAREKAIRNGHPSSLHLWWARRPLAAARAVLFAQLVDDPAGDIGDPIAGGKQRPRLHRPIERLDQWESTNHQQRLGPARDERREPRQRRRADTAAPPR